MNRFWIICSMLCLTLASCSTEQDRSSAYTPTPQPLPIPKVFSDRLIAPVIPVDNPQTAEGIILGQRLFFDTKLSADNSQSCASCHKPEQAFSDTTSFSTGIDGIEGDRNTMPLFNLAWNYDENFFWDGRIFSLENQVFIPITDPVELHNTTENVVLQLQNDPEYPELFQQAFGTSTITANLTAKALAQFERTLISANSRFDQYLLGTITLTPEELNGFNVFMTETKGDCFHCHGSDNNPLWTDNLFHNNGLDAEFTDLALGEFTGDPAENGKFKTPSLRNLKFTAPYMHDGRFKTLDEVINHYSEGLQFSATIDPLMKRVAEGGVHLTDKDKADLKAFLLALSDDEYVTKTTFLKP